MDTEKLRQLESGDLKGVTTEMKWIHKDTYINAASQCTGQYLNRDSRDS